MSRNRSGSVIGKLKPCLDERSVGAIYLKVERNERWDGHPGQVGMHAVCNRMGVANTSDTYLAWRYRATSREYTV
jgi:hypothetical protein